MSWVTVHFSLAAILVLGSSSAAPDKLEMRMPNVTTQGVDNYMCTGVQVKDKHLYLTGFKANAKMSVVHHILLFGCVKPGMTTDVWNCGEMDAENAKNAGPVCEEGQTIIYAWAMDAPPLQLPKGVSFDVGQLTHIPYLVLQVHYKNEQTEPDHSGLTIDTTPKPTEKTAGVIILGSDGVIPAGSTAYLETSCTYNDKEVLHPFAYRVHTHSLGKVVSGYVAKSDPYQGQKWIEIGRKNPQLPQMFYNVSTPGVEVHQGDLMAARCTMKNDGDKDVAIGSTQQDEMCNFYIMYYVDGHKLPEQTSCYNSLGNIFREEGWPVTASIDPMSPDEAFEESESIVRELNHMFEELEEEWDPWDSYEDLEDMQNNEYYPQEMPEGYYQRMAEGYYDRYGDGHDDGDDDNDEYPPAKFDGDEDIERQLNEIWPERMLKEPKD